MPLTPGLRGRAETAVTPENTAEAVKRYHPFAVDVSSGIETDGFKDCNKMRAFMRAVREGDSE